MLKDVAAGPQSLDAKGAAKENLSTPTPMRSRRALSPVPSTKRITSSHRNTLPRAALENDVTVKQNYLLGFVAPFRAWKATGITMIIIALLVGLGLHQRTPLRNASGSPSNQFDGGQPEAVSSLPQSVKRALNCSGVRANILDMLAGAPYEFNQSSMPDKDFYRLPRLAAAGAQGGTNSNGREELEAAFENEVLQIISSGGGWPPAFQRRLAAVLWGPCNSSSFCEAAQQPLPFEVDEEFTSPRAVTETGMVHRALLTLAELTGLPFWKSRAELYRSHHAAIVLSSAPVKAGECLALRGDNSTLAMELSPVNGEGRAALIQQVVIQQPVRWAHRLGTLPRRFAVYGWPGDHEKGSLKWSNPYFRLLGNFEYVAAGPAAQAFRFSHPLFAKGLRLIFEGPQSGEKYICVYRVKAFDAKGHVCTDGRVAASSQRLVEV